MRAFFRFHCESISRRSTLRVRFVLNDTYRTDVHLLYPPYIISLSALYIGFCLTAMNNPSGTRARSSSSQVTNLASSAESDIALGLPSPPAGSAEFLATFQVSLPTIFACIQDIIVLYPIWEAFDSSRTTGNTATTTAALLRSHPAPGQAKDIKEKFTVEDAEPTVEADDRG